MWPWPSSLLKQHWWHKPSPLWVCQLLSCVQQPPCVCVPPYQHDSVAFHIGLDNFDALMHTHHPNVATSLMFSPISFSVILSDSSSAQVAVRWSSAVPLRSPNFIYLHLLWLSPGPLVSQHCIFSISSCSTTTSTAKTCEFSQSKSLDQVNAPHLANQARVKQGEMGNMQRCGSRTTCTHTLHKHVKITVIQ